jgi:stage IV sporulation protein FB
LFFEPPRTPYDLNWRMFGITVRVHPWFWLMGVILGWSAVEDGIQYLLLWIACVFVSILVHEFGHVFMGLVFGNRGHIVLYSFGGLAIGSSDLDRHWKRIAVYFAGPLAGFLLFGLVFGLTRLVNTKTISDLGREFFNNMIYINLAWGFLNLLPIWPLDGGRISNDLFDWFLPGRGTKISLGLSVGTASILALNGISLLTNDRALPLLEHIPFLNTLGGKYTIVLFCWLAFNSLQALMAESQRPPWDREGDRF